MQEGNNGDVELQNLGRDKSGIQSFDRIESSNRNQEKKPGYFEGITKWFTTGNAAWAAGKANDFAEASGAKWAAGKTTKRLAEFILGRGTVENLRTPGKRLKGTMQAIGMGGLFIASVVCFFTLGPIGPLVGGLLGVAHLGAKQTNSIGKRAHEKGEDKLRSLLKGDMDPKTLEQLNAKEKDRAESKEKRNESLSSGVKWGIFTAILTVTLIMFAPMLVPALGGLAASAVCTLPLVAAGVSAYKFNDAYKHHRESKNLKSSINQLYNSQLDSVLQDPAKTQNMCNEIGTEKLDALLKKTGKRIEKGKEVSSLNKKLVQSVEKMEVEKLTCLNESTKKIIGQIKSGTLSETDLKGSAEIKPQNVQSIFNS